MRSTFFPADFESLRVKVSRHCLARLIQFKGKGSLLEWIRKRTDVQLTWLLFGAPCCWHAPYTFQLFFQSREQKALVCQTFLVSP